MKRRPRAEIAGKRLAYMIRVGDRAHLVAVSREFKLDEARAIGRVIASHYRRAVSIAAIDRGMFPFTHVGWPVANARATNPTLVHHGLAERAQWHLFMPLSRGNGIAPIADLYTGSAAWAATVARFMAKLTGEPISWTRNAHAGFRTLDEHVAAAKAETRRRGNPKRGRVVNSNVLGALTLDELRDVTELETWFERDRQHVELRWKDDGETIVEWWDEAVTEAVDDGFLNPRDWHGSALEYARDVGLLEKSVKGRRVQRRLARSRKRNPESAYIGEAILGGRTFGVERVEPMRAGGKPSWLIKGTRGATYGLVLPVGGEDRPGQPLIATRLLGRGGVPRFLAGLRIVIGHTGLPEARGRNPISPSIAPRSIRTVGRGRKRIFVGCRRGQFHPKARGARKCAGPMRRVYAGRRRRKNPPTASELAAARKTFRKWHAFDAESVDRIKAPRTIPRVLVKLGEMVQFVYRSNKWGGRMVTYEHTTRKPRPVLCTGPDGRGLFLVGGRTHVTARGLVD